jgi:hypothetical protein
VVNGVNDRRRRLLQALGAAAAALPASAAPQPPRPAGGWQLEWQRSDADIDFEPLAFDPEAVLRAVAKKDRARFEQREKAFGAALIAQAAQWVGKGRANATDDIAKLLKIFDLPFAIDGKPVPFCAAGASYAAAQVYARRYVKDEAKLTPELVAEYLGDIDHHHFAPTPSVWDIYYVARGKRRWKDADPVKLTPKLGWLVVFDFGKGADHVGIVESYAAGIIHTIEFNTVPDNAVGSEANGGMVARRKRHYSVPMIKGFIRTDLARPI